jgi:signal transduction histidine kinase
MVGALQRSYEQLEEEIRVRCSAEAELSEYRDHLEHLVDERTEELLRLNEDLTQATRAKDDFLASMSHELRTPLNSIIGFTEIMLRGLAGDLNEEQRRQLRMVHESGQQLLLLVDDVLDLARINAGHIKVSAEEFSLVEAVSRLTEMMQPLAAAKHLDLTYRFDGNAPYAIRSDRGKVDQIMLNLLSNAIKFTGRARCWSSCALMATRWWRWTSSTRVSGSRLRKGSRYSNSSTAAITISPPRIRAPAWGCRYRGVSRRSSAGALR